MTEIDLYAIAYNAHEEAEARALDALRASLESEPIEALAVLADPSWGWEKRGSLSGWIVDQADDVLNEKLDALVTT